MNAKQKLRQANLVKWTALFKEQAESGLTIKDFCVKHELSFHAYNYWKHVVKEAYVESLLPEIVPLTPHLADPVPTYICDSSPDSCDSLNSLDSRQPAEATPLPDTNRVSVSIDDVNIEIGSSASDELILKIIKAVRYA